MNKFYAVTTKCGHVGRGKFIEVTFPVVAESGREAALKGKAIPRVKHDNKYAIVDVKRITEDEYTKLQENVSKDPYLRCRNSQEQRKTCPNIGERIQYLYKIEDHRSERKERVKMLKNINKVNERYALKQAKNDYRLMDLDNEYMAEGGEGYGFIWN